MGWHPCCCEKDCCNGGISTWPVTMHLTISIPTRPCFDGLVYTLTQSTAGPLVYSWFISTSINVSSCYYAGDSMSQSGQFGCNRVGSFSPGWVAGAPIGGSWPSDGRDRCFFGNITVSSVDCTNKIVVFHGTLVPAAGNPCAGGDPFTLTVTT